MQYIQKVNVNEQINDQEKKILKVWTTEKSVKMCTCKRELKEHLDKLDIPNVRGIQNGAIKRALLLLS